MAVIANTSTTTTLYGTVWEAAPPTDPPPAWALAPCASAAYGNSDGSPAAFYFYHHAASEGTQQTPFFAGYLDDNEVAHIVPEIGQVDIVDRTLTQHDLDMLKKALPDDPRIQDVTLAQLQQYAKGKDWRGGSAQPMPGGSVPREMLTDCQWAVGGLALDLVFVATGLVGLHGKMQAQAIQEAAQIVEPVANELEHAAKILATKPMSATEWWGALKDFLHVLWSGSHIEPLFKAALSSLTWWDAALYGALGIATIAAAFLTETASIVATVAAEVALIGFVASDSLKVVQACETAA